MCKVVKSYIYCSICTLNCTKMEGLLQVEYIRGKVQIEGAAIGVSQCIEGRVASMDEGWRVLRRFAPGWIEMFANGVVTASPPLAA